jgi:hypothetical protein
MALEVIFVGGNGFQAGRTLALDDIYQALDE